MKKNFNASNSKYFNEENHPNVDEVFFNEKKTRSVGIVFLKQGQNYTQIAESIGKIAEDLYADTAV